jgi:MYXO-CTERM domain-containing protein
MTSILELGIAAVILLGLAEHCSSAAFDVQFSAGNVVWGTGEIIAAEIAPGTFLATAWSFQMTAGPYSTSFGTLVSTAGHNLWAEGNSLLCQDTPGRGTAIGCDYLILQTSPTTFALADWGLFLDDPSFPRAGGAGPAFNPWLNAPGLPGCSGPGDCAGAFDGYDYQPWFHRHHGTITVTEVTVTDSWPTLWLLGLGLVALGWVRRRSVQRPPRVGSPARRG